jgi:hypothetical protein
MGADGSGWYTTQGFAMLTERDNVSFYGEITARVRPRYWAPTVAYRFAHRGGALHLYASGAFGSANPSPTSPFDEAPVRAVMAGISVERRVRTPILLGPTTPPPPP